MKKISIIEDLPKKEGEQNKMAQLAVACDVVTEQQTTQTRQRRVTTWCTS